MNIDLRQGLRDLGQSERPFLTELPVELLQQRAHRQRAVRTTAYSAVGVGAAAAVAVGGVAGAGLLRDRQAPPAPPATSTPDPRPTPSSTPTPTPTADPATPVTPAWAPDWQACGSVYFDDSFYNLDGDADWLMWTDQERIAQVDQPFTIEPRLRSSGREGQAVEVALTDVTATRFDPSALTWEIVGVAAQEPSSQTSGAIPAGGTGLALTPAPVSLTSCEASPLAGGNGAPAPLDPAESYTLVGTAEVTFPDGRSLTVTGTLGTVGAEQKDESVARPVQPLIPGTPTRISYETVVAGGSQEYPEPLSSTWCGADASTANLPSGVSYPDLPVALTGTGFRDGSELVVQMSATNTGAPIARAVFTAPSVTVVRDGRVIGRAWEYELDHTVTGWPAGTTAQLEFSLGDFTCTFMQGEPWPAGSYEVYANTGMSRAPEGTPVDHDAAYLTGGPWTFTLE